MTEKTETFRGFEILEDGQLAGANACCFGEEHVGHPFCFEPAPVLVEAEEAGLISRHFGENGWRFYLNPDTEPAGYSGQGR